MGIKDITDQSRRADLAARQEKLAGPDVIQMPGTGRGGGTSEPEIHDAYCMEDAQSSTVINCWLDYDGSQATTWEEKHYEVGEMVVGTDGFIYRCKSEHDATTDNKPVTGDDSGEVWSVVLEINVYCRIYGGGYLNTAIPDLVTGYPMEVRQDEDGIWRALKTFNGSVICEIFCEEV